MWAPPSHQPPLQRREGTGRRSQQRPGDMQGAWLGSPSCPSHVPQAEACFRKLPRDTSSSTTKRGTVTAPSTGTLLNSSGGRTSSSTQPSFDRQREERVSANRQGGGKKPGSARAWQSGSDLHQAAGLAAGNVLDLALADLALPPGGRLERGAQGQATQRDTWTVPTSSRRRPSSPPGLRPWHGWCCRGRCGRRGGAGWPGRGRQGLGAAARGRGNRFSCYASGDNNPFFELLEAHVLHH